MLPEENSLTKNEDFEEVRRQGRLFQSESFALSAAKRGDKKPARFGFVVSTKIAKQATLRNRVKRALREAVRQSLTYVVPGYDFVFLAKPVIVRKVTAEIMREVTVGLKNNGFLQ